MGAGPHPRRRPHQQELPRAARSRGPSPIELGRSSSTAPAASARCSPPRPSRDDGLHGRRLDGRRLPGAGRRRGCRGRCRPTLTAEQKQRYSRHLLIPEVGLEGQAKLLDSKVLFIGAGGLGSPAMLYLAAAGVGTIGIVDFDVVDLSNLQRQVIHTNDRIGEKKVESARETIQALNPDVKVVAHEEMLVADNVERIIAGYDVIIDGTDTFETRYLLNDAAVVADIPVVHACVFRFEGQLTVFEPYEGPCYRCLYPTPPPPELAPGCSVAGVLGVVPGIMGLLQANEALKLLLGHRRPAGRPAAPVRCARRLVQRAAAAPRPGLPGLLRRRRRGACARAVRWPSPAVGDDGPFALGGPGLGVTALRERRPHPAGPPRERRRREAGRHPGATVGELLDGLVTAHPGLRDQLFTSGRRAQPVRQRLPQRPGRPLSRRDRDAGRRRATSS